jgi:hypothetical protein
MNYLLSYDHRIIDGREAVLPSGMKEALEDPARCCSTSEWRRDASGPRRRAARPLRRRGAPHGRLAVFLNAVLAIYIPRISPPRRWRRGGVTVAAAPREPPLLPHGSSPAPGVCRVGYIARLWLR